MSSAARISAMFYGSPRPIRRACETMQQRDGVYVATDSMTLWRVRSSKICMMPKPALLSAVNVRGSG